MKYTKRSRIAMFGGLGWAIFLDLISSRYQGSGIRDQGSGIREQGTGIRVQGSGNSDQGTGIRDQATGNCKL